MLQIAVLPLLFALCVGETVLEFIRPLNTCDANDFVISRGTMRMIYAYGADYTSTPSYHVARGTKSMQLLDVPVPQGPYPPDTQQLDILMSDVHVASGIPLGFSDARTTYWCRAVKFPETPDKRHIIRAEPVITPTSMGKAHHMLLYECSSPIADANVNWSGSCDDRQHMPREMRNCRGQKPMAAWAIGGGAFSWPDEAGYPLGGIGGNGAKYAVLEMHYDNFDLQPFVDNSGVRLFHTSTLRPHDAQIAYFGYWVDETMTIPPHEPAYEVTAQCPGSSTTEFLPAEGVNVFASMLHMHTAGRRINSKIVRNGTVVTEFAEPYYDFAFQETLSLPRPYPTLERGDTITTSCVYDTSDRDTVTVGGLSSNFEMCLTFLHYYGAIDNFNGFCFSGYVNGSDPQFGEVPKGTPGSFELSVALFNNTYVANPVNLNPITVETPAPVCVRNSSLSLASGERPAAALRPLEDFDASQYEYSEMIDHVDQKVRLHWRVDVEKQEIKMAAQFETDGWVGLGLSPTGGMAGADIVLASVEDGSRAVVTDRHAVTEGLPLVDDLQDIGRITLYKSQFSDEASKEAGGKLDDKMSISWSRDAAANRVRIEVRTTQADEWFAIGLSETGLMAPAVALISKPDETPGFYRITEHSKNGITPVSAGEFGASFLNVVSSVQAGVRVLSFSINTVDPPPYFRGVSGGTNTMVTFARGSIATGTRTAAAAIGDNWQKHINAGSLAIDFGGKSGQIGAVSTVDRMARMAFIVHGILAFTAVCVLFPAGVIMRYYPNAARAHTFHVALQLGGAGTALLAIVIAIMGVMLSNGNHFSEPHHRIGLAMLIAIVVMVAAGFMRPHKSTNERAAATPKRRAFEVGHALLGRVIVIGGIVNAFLGVSMGVIGAPAGLEWGVVVWGVAIGVALIALRIRKDQESISNPFQSMSTVEGEEEGEGKEDEDDAL